MTDVYHIGFRWSPSGVFKDDDEIEWIEVSEEEYNRVAATAIPLVVRQPMSKSADHAAEALQAILAAISTNDLIDELVSRDGVQMFTTQPDVKYVIEDEDRLYENGDGPARIITVVDP
jgi:hypothetical protein